MLRDFAFTAGLVLSCWLGASVAAAEEYRFVTLEFPPLEYLNDRGQPDGAVVELIHAIMARLGHTAKIEVLPWSRAVSLIKTGKADAIFTAYRNKERESYLDFAHENLITQVVALYVKTGSKRTFNGSFAPLKKYVFGTLNTISYGDRFDAAKTKLKTERVETLSLNFKKLVAGRIDYVISNRYSAEIEIESLRLVGLVQELPLSVETTESYVAFAKKNHLTPLRDGFDRELRALKKLGRYQEILDKYRVRAPVAE